MKIKSKKLITTLCTTAIIGLLGSTTVFAANTGASPKNTAPNFFNRTSTSMEKTDWSALSDEQKAEMKGQMKGNLLDMSDLTDEQKAEMEANRPGRAAAIAELTDEQKTEMKTKMEALNEKRTALTDAQKEEISALQDKAADIKSQISDKYLEFGFDEQSVGIFNKTEMTDEQKTEMKANRPELTDEQKAEMESKMTEMKTKMEALNEKWAVLTDTQKEKIYALQDEAAAVESQIIDKYLAFGLIDEQIATDRKTQITENTTTMRESDEMPMLGGRGELGGKGEFRGAPPTEAESTKTSD